MAKPLYNERNIEILLKKLKELSDDKLVSQRSVALFLLGKAKPPGGRGASGPVSTINTAIHDRTKWRSITRPMFYCILEFLEKQEQDIGYVDLSDIREQFEYS